MDKFLSSLAARFCKISANFPTSGHKLNFFLKTVVLEVQQGAYKTQNVQGNSALILNTFTFGFT